jgi:hypothetical protein
MTVITANLAMNPGTTGAGRPRDFGPTMACGRHGMYRVCAGTSACCVHCRSVQCNAVQSSAVGAVVECPHLVPKSRFTSLRVTASFSLSRTRQSLTEFSVQAKLVRFGVTTTNPFISAFYSSHSALSSLTLSRAVRHTYYSPPILSDVQA